jgi:hypothetical protein
MITRYRPLKGIFLFFFALLLFVFSQCRSHFSSIGQHAFYYWETNFELDSADESFLKSMEVKKLYLRFFDVDFEQVPLPVGQVRFETKIPTDLEIVPVVFITNKTISSLDTMGIRDLSQKMVVRINKEIARTQIAKQVKEIQIDCDWTTSTKNKYFYLLTLLQDEFSYELSATIRLHQYKYHKNNIPPVKKGMLMCYNINAPNKFEVKNSLFNKEEVLSYVQNVEYPLPLDLAMPTFSWGVLFDQNKQFIGLANGMRLAEVLKDTNFAKTDRPEVFLVKHDAYTQSRYLNQGTLVRVEECDMKEVREVIDFLKNQLQQNNATISLYHYNSLHKTNENKEQISILFNAAH